MKDLLDLFELGMARNIKEVVPFNYREGSVNLNVGCGNKEIPNTIGIDYPEWDADKDPLPYEDDSVDVIFAFHFLEHCKHPIKVLQDFQRVLKIGGVVNIVVPYYTSQMQAHDLDHKHTFCEETWRNLFSNEFYDKNRVSWHFEIGTNVIIGIVERNLALVTQLIKTDKG